MIRRYFARRKMRWAVRHLAAMGIPGRLAFRSRRTLNRMVLRHVQDINAYGFPTMIAAAKPEDAGRAMQVEKFMYATYEEFRRKRS